VIDTFGWRIGGHDAYNIVGDIDFGFAWGTANLALQPILGVLSQWGPWAGARDSDRVDLDSISVKLSGDMGRAEGPRVWVPLGGTSILGANR
jgi:hypothetical protein